MKFLYAKNTKQNCGFAYMTFKGLTKVVKNPIKQHNIKTLLDAKDKYKTPCLGASDAMLKRLDEVLAHNNMTLVRLDLDDGSYGGIDKVCANIEKLGIYSYIVHTSASHQQEGKGERYRVYIELACSIPVKVWQSLESYLCYKFNADDCAERPQQIMFLPCDFEGINYDYRIKCGDALDPDFSDLKDDVELYIKQRDKEQAKYAQSLLKISKLKSQRNENLLTGQLSILDAVNKAWKWEDLLTHYGYKRQGKAWLPPESKSGSAGVYILVSNVDGKERYYSHHENDPCKIKGHCLDKFDFICIRQYGGNEYECLLSMGKEFLEITKYNQDVYLKIKGGKC